MPVTISRLPHARWQPHAPRRVPQRLVQVVAGFTLVELLIGMFLGLVAVGALFTVYLSARANFRRDDQIAQVQENARFALDALTRDLQNGGYFGGLIFPSSDIQSLVSFSGGTPTLVSGASDCGPPTATGVPWLYDFTKAFYFRNQTVTAPIGNAFPCLVGITGGVSAISDKSDIVAVKRVSTQNDGTGTDGTITFSRATPALSLVTTSSNTGGVSVAGLVMQPSAVNTPVPLGSLSCTDATGSTSVACQPQGGTVSGFRLLPSVYYVRKFTRVLGDGVPALCRRVLAIPMTATAPYADECIATGVENMQIEWGVSASPSSPVVDHYTSTPLDTDFSGGLVRTARIYLLMRSASLQVNQWQLIKNSGATRGPVDDPRTYVMTPNDYSSSPDNRSTVTSTPGSDSFYRKLYTVTVQLKNASLRSGA